MRADSPEVGIPWQFVLFGVRQREHARARSVTDVILPLEQGPSDLTCGCKVYVYIPCSTLHYVSVSVVFRHPQDLGCVLNTQKPEIRTSRCQWDWHLQFVVRCQSMGLGREGGRSGLFGSVHLNLCLSPRRYWKCVPCWNVVDIRAQRKGHPSDKLWSFEPDFYAIFI